MVVNWTHSVYEVDCTTRNGIESPYDSFWENGSERFEISVKAMLLTEHQENMKSLQGEIKSSENG